jgi:hypothetical protein
MMQDCECCDTYALVTKIHGIYCCAYCDNFECKKCGLENDKTGELINWNKKLKMCVCDDCAYIKPVPKIVITDKVVVIRRPKKPKSVTELLLEKLNGCGIDVLISILGDEFRRSITNMKSSSIPLERRKGLAIKTIMEFVAKGDSIAISNRILETYFAPKEPKNTEWLNDFVVGEEVISKYAPQERPSLKNIYRKGIVSKINKKSLTIRLFAYKEIDDMDAIQNQTFGYNRLIWETRTNETQIIFDRMSIAKKGQETYYDAHFVEGKRLVDWGY